MNDQHCNHTSQLSTYSLIPSQVRQPHTSSTSTESSQSSTSASPPLFGDSPQIKSPNSIRLILQNPNGISHYNECFEYHTCIDQMQENLADIICLTETNIQWNSYKITNQCRKYRQNIFNHSKQISSHSSKTYNSPYQPGGTCTILCNHLVG